MAYIKKTPEQRFQDKKDVVKKKRVDHYKSLKYKKLISMVARTIIKYNDLQIENKPFSEILRTLYNRDDKIIKVRVKRMLQTDIAKKDINNELMRLFNENGIDPKEKVVYHTKKASEDAKNTNEHLSCARFFKEIAGFEPKTKVKEERTYNNFADLMENKPVKIKQTVQSDVGTMTDGNQKVQKEAENEENDDV